MKIIVSHDVDHLFQNDHYADLIYPKLWVRETTGLLNRQLTFDEWRGRIASTFRKKRHYLDELMVFDKAHGVKSTFFFGMEKGLGMSYKAEVAKPVIKYVEKNGFDVGVHGINYTNRDLMKKEYNRFSEIAGHPPRGIRMHYVRYDKNTFENLSACGYLYDSTEFDKDACTCNKPHYSVGKMIEFPLTVMDGYLPYPKELAKKKTYELIKAATANGVKYVTILFHDYQYTSGWRQTKLWYEEIIREMEASSDYEFVSFEQAVEEIQKNGE